MIPVCEFVVHGDPVPKGRPRVARNGGVYTPERTRDAEALVRWSAGIAMRGATPVTEPVAVHMTFWTRTNRRCDLDNLIKLVLDACNNIVWRDDQQVTHIDAAVHRRSGTEPRTEVHIFHLDPERTAA